MPAIKPFRTPWEAAQALVEEHAFTKYGIKDADPLRVVTDMVFAESTPVVGEDGEVHWIGPSPELRLNAAKTLLKYTRPEVRAVHMHVEGNVEVDHTHRVEAIQAKNKARNLLELIGAAKYTSGAKAAEEAAELEHLPTDVVPH
jgi:hypothetical protein